MNYNSAMSRAAQGKTIYRSYWLQKAILYFPKGTETDKEPLPLQMMYPSGAKVNYHPTDEDKLANDWIVIE